MSKRLSKKKYKRALATKDTSVIPSGPYCYGIVENTLVKTDEGIPYIDSGGFIKTNPCPYWSINARKPYQSNGYCNFLEEGDWQHGGFGILWDQVKCCGINDDINDDNIFCIPLELVDK